MSDKYDLEIMLAVVKCYADSLLWATVFSPWMRTNLKYNPIVNMRIFILISIILLSTSLKIPSKPILVKYGGNAMTKPELSDLFCKDVVSLTKQGT